MRRGPATAAGLLALLLLLTLSGCWQEELPQDTSILPISPTEEAASGDTGPLLPKRFALPYMPGRTLDPITCPDGMQQMAASLLYEGLFRLDAALEPQPCLCSSYTYDPESFRYVFTLREGVLFSDGTPLTAADARAALEQARLSPRYQSRLAKVASISASRDGRTLTVALTGPNRAFPALLDIPIVKSGTQDRTVPTGTGPYCFSQEGGEFCLTANPSWWQGGGQPVSAIFLADAADRDTMFYRFSSHDVQLITADLTGADSVSTTGSVVCLDACTTILQYVGCNTASAPLNSSVLRQALSIGISRSGVVSAFLSGHGTAAQFPISPASPLYPAALESRYSLDAFAAALAAAGPLPQRPLTLLVNAENSFKQAIAGYLAESYTAAGLPVEVRSLPWEEYLAALTAGNFDLYYGEVRLTADWDLTSLVGTGGTLNYGRWSDPQTDQLLADCAAAEDRAAALQALCADLQRQAPILPVCFKSTSVLMQTGVLEGLSPTMAEPFYNLTSCTIHLAEP